jgi:hypothetical protein
VGKYDKALAELDAPAAPQESHPLHDLGEAAVGTVVGAVQGLPFGKDFVEGASKLAGHPEFPAQLEKDVPLAVGAGKLTTGVASAAALPEAKAASALGRIAEAGAQNTVLGGIYKLGDVTADLINGRTPLQIEQLTHQLFGEQSLKDSLMDFAFGSAGGTLHEGLRAAAPAVQNAAKKFANSKAGKFFDSVAPKLGLDPSELGARALDEHLLDRPGNTTAKKDAAGNAIESISASTKVTPEITDQFTEALAPHFEEAQGVASLDKTRQFIAKHVDRLITKGDKLSGEDVGNVIKALGEKSRASKGQIRQLLGDSTQALRDVFSKHIELMDGPEQANKYLDAVQDYRTYAKMEAGADKGAGKQASLGDWLEEAAASATGVGEIARVLGHQSAFTKSQAVLLDQFSKLPLGRTADLIGDTAKAVLSGSSHTFRDQKNPHDDYDLHSHMLEQVQADPMKAASHIRAKLNFLPGQDADAVTSKVMGNLTEQAQQMPKPTLSTMFGPVAASGESEKRRAMDFHRASLDPYWAVQSGSQELIQVAEKSNPATVAAIKNQILDAMAKRKDISYEAKQRIGTLFGQAGTPLQNPVIGIALQNSLKQATAANSDPGQKNSARNAAAQMKQNKASLTRAQTLLTLGNKQ